MFAIIPGRHDVKLAAQIAALLNCQLNEISYQHFSNGDPNIILQPPIRGRKCFLLMNGYPNLSQSVTDIMIVLDAVRRAAAVKIILVNLLPPYSVKTSDDEQEQIELDRFPHELTIRAKLSGSYAKLFEFHGCDEVITVELARPQWEGMFRVPVSNLDVSREMADCLQNLTIQTDITFVPVELDGGARCLRVMKHLQERECKCMEMTHIYKRKHKDEWLQEEDFDFKNKHVIFIDHFIRTGKRLREACEFVISQGARKCQAIIAHAYLTDGCVEWIESCDCLSAVYISDSLENNINNLNSKKIIEYSIAPVLAKAIQRIIDDEELLDMIVDD